MSRAGQGGAERERAALVTALRALADYLEAAGQRQPAPPPEPQATERRLPAPVSMNTRDAAALLGIGKRKMYELLDKGELQSFYTGRLRLIPMSVLTDFVDRKLAENVSHGRHGEQTQADAENVQRILGGERI